MTFWRLRIGRRSVVHPPSDGKGLKDIQHIMNIVLVTRFYTWWLWNFIRKWDSYYHKMWHIFYYKMRQKFITKCVRLFVTKYESFIAKRNSFCKVRGSHYKMLQFLQNATFITKCVDAKFNEGMSYTSHFVVFHPFLRRPQILLTLRQKS